MGKGFFAPFAQGKEEKDLREQDKKDNQAGKKPVFEAQSLQEAANYLAAVKAKADAGHFDEQLDKEGITTATEPERIEYLNYCIQLIPEKYAKHKMLLFLLVNPWSKDKNGDGRYLSKRQIAYFLQKECGFIVLEHEVSKVEKEALEMCKQAIASTRNNSIPLVGSR